MVLADQCYNTGAELQGERQLTFINKCITGRIIPCIAMQVPFTLYCEKKGNKKYFIDKPLIVTLGKKIRHCRILKELSIEKLANECEVDPTQVGRMELGKVNFSISMLYKIAGALEVDAKKLLP